MTIESEYLFTVRLVRDGDHAVRIVDGPRGTTSIAPVGAGGTFEGPGLAGTIVTGTSGDWATMCADGSFLVDARLTLLIDDGTPVLMSYRGVGAFDAQGDAWMHIAPVFETGPGPHEWLNRLQAVGFGRFEDDGVAYEVHRVVGLAAD